MSACKILFFLLLALCVLCGTCNVLYHKVGSEVSMDCEVASNSDVEWRFNNIRYILILGKSGKQLKGKEWTNRVYPNGGILKIIKLESRDSGVYSCTQTGKTFTVRVVSDSVLIKPGPVLVQSSDAELHCIIPGSPETEVKWIKPNNQIHDQKNQVLHLKSVTSADSGRWTCLISNLNLIATLTVVDLQTNNVEVSEGVDVELPCFLPHPVSQRVVNWKWDAKNQLRDSFPTLKYTDGKGWSGKNSSRVTFKSEKLITSYNITLSKVKPEDKGTYECMVAFEGGVELTAQMNLTVHKSSGGQTEGKTHLVTVVLTKDILGLKLWIWVAIGTAIGAVFLVGLVVVTFVVHRRNKRMKKKARKMRSLRQPLTAKDYCHCSRNGVELQLGRPLPVPRQQRNPRPAKSPNLDQAALLTHTSHHTHPFKT